MNSVNKKEIEKFSKMAAEWWDPSGKFKPLHKFNPIRIKYIKENIINSFKIKTKKKPLNKNGIMFISTINKTLKSYLFAIVGAEYVLKWLPIGTHDWNKFIKPKQKPLDKINILDIGCGGGLLSEPMTRLGANVTGIDASSKNIKIAKLHAKKSKLKIN